MTQLYDEMELLHQVVASLISILKKTKEVLKLLKVSSRVVDQLQKWVSKYLNVPQQFFRKDMITTEMD